MGCQSALPRHRTPPPSPAGWSPWRDTICGSPNGDRNRRVPAGIPPAFPGSTCRRASAACQHPSPHRRPSAGVSSRMPPRHRILFRPGNTAVRAPQPCVPSAVHTTHPDFLHRVPQRTCYTPSLRQDATPPPQGLSLRRSPR